MSRLTVGWYIHHHGHGHLTRFLAIRRHLDADVVCFSSLPEPVDLPAGTTWIRIEPDNLTETTTEGRTVDPVSADPTVDGLLHWAPLGHHGHRSRLARIAVEALRGHLSAFVVDVSVEVTLFVRLLGIPVVLVGQPGDRSDEAHALAYRAATRILAPWPRGLVPLPDFGDRVEVVHTGGISRFDGREVTPVPERSGVLVLLGSGGGDASDEDVDALTHALPDDVRVVGAGHEWEADPWPLLVDASVVVSWAGQNSIADLAAARARSIVIPQARPFDEQEVTARSLDRAGLAIVEDSWPDAWRWPEIIDRARTLTPSWSIWQTNGAAARAATAILEIASRWRV